ncbi:hypothetical protein M422DRAFT_266436 [Sphaerobolus stellatus SS14]|uniref:Uncharacterized protein n=1 Tax=Sphaerobolus stellatus (strain SS14) TaxID=990650 RepID=A0A0C9V2T0_SPHS4|nr:hypothetical protein M422DRAFT_266436 [Sphaerobolus stellatus SS14]
MSYFPRSLDDGVVIEGNALLVDLAITTLVVQLEDGLKIVLTMKYRNEQQTVTEHLQGGFSGCDENTVFDLQETQELEDLAGLGTNLGLRLTNPANHCHLGMVGSINALTTGNKTFADFQAAAMGTTANSTTAAGNTTVPAGGVASAASNGAFKAASSGLTVALALVAGQSSFYEFSHELIGVILFIYILPFEIRYQACRFEFGLGRPTGLESSWGSPSANLTHCI